MTSKFRSKYSNNGFDILDDKNIDLFAKLYPYSRNTIREIYTRLDSNVRETRDAIDVMSKQCSGIDEAVQFVKGKRIPVVPLRKSLQEAEKQIKEIIYNLEYRYDCRIEGINLVRFFEAESAKTKVFVVEIKAVYD